MDEFDRPTSLGPAPGGTVRQLVTAVAIPRLELQVVREAGAATDRREVLAGDRVRIGSHPSNDLTLADPLVSRFHCTLARGERNWSLTDNESLNGVELSGVRVRDADVPRPQCELKLGDSVVIVRELGSTGVDPVPEVAHFGELYGESVAMRRVFALLERVASSEATVLLEGESGTGKELAARELARSGPRGGKPFVVLDCGAISPNLIESELFGHARGAFTGAERTRTGAFEEADGGTIFLDEIGELPIEMQPKLLRALEAGEVRPVGENRPRTVDVRVIAATNRNLEREVNKGRFREDLYFRLSVITVRLPPLRKRLEDLPQLINVLLASMNAAEAQHLFTDEVLAEMSRHDWPGNVRELRNYVERAVVLDAAGPASQRPQRTSMLPAEPGGDASAAYADIETPFRVAKEALVTDFERAYLSQLMQWAEGNVSRAARKAKMDRMYLHRLLQRHELKESK